LEEYKLRRILVSGLIACFLVGILIFLLRFVIFDILAPIFRPLILLFGEEYLVVPLSIVISFLVVLGVGYLTTRVKFQNVYNRYIRRVPQDLETGRGALVLIGPETYFLAVIINEIQFKRANGEVQEYYVLFCPSVPLPWSGMPITVAEKKKVIPLVLSYGELYTIVGSFGRNTPELLVELRSLAVM
jgi:uncharacterized membrane protein